MKTKFYAQELTDEQFNEVFNRIKDWIREDDGITDDEILAEMADDYINRHNQARTLEEWNEF